jgi:hypothetical protein
MSGLQLACLGRRAVAASTVEEAKISACQGDEAQENDF